MNYSELNTEILKHGPKKDMGYMLECLSKLCPDGFDDVIPSYKLGTVAPELDGLFFLSREYLCEVRMSNDSSEEDFDVIRIDTISNIRVGVGVKDVKTGENSSKQYHTARVKLHHYGSSDMATIFNYVGESSVDWLNKLLPIIPKPRAIFWEKSKSGL